MENKPLVSFKKYITHHKLHDNTMYPIIKLNNDNSEVIFSLNGPKDTIIEDIEFWIEVTYTKNYPFQPPNCKLVKPDFFLHPNITENKTICIGNTDWSPACTLKSLIFSISQLLINPDFNSGYNIKQMYQLGDVDWYPKMIKELF